jgi:beta-glucosidase
VQWPVLGLYAAANGIQEVKSMKKRNERDTSAAHPQRAPYLDPSLPRPERVKDLISRMSLEEKASMMANSTPGIPRLGIPKYDWWSEALHGVAVSGNATVFPQAIGLAAMWDEALLHEIAGIVGIEGRAKFNGYAGGPLEGAIFRGLTFWSPNINIFRDPRWGRGQETYGEDPFLTSRLGVAFVRGLQGDHPDYLAAAACAKHFAVHSGPEPLRHNFDASPPEADLRETYLPAFEALCREARVEIAMTAYNELYGTPCSVSPLLYRLLEEWGFDGHVTSDCGSVADLSRTYKRAADDAEAEAMTLKAGMNLRCGGEPSGIVEAVRRGLLSEAELDSALFPLMRTMFRLGFFDPRGRVPFNAITISENDTPEHGALALRAARESLVLLKNDGILPLRKEGLRRVAVIGPNATSVPALLGSYNGEPSAPVTILAGIKAAFEPDGIQVLYAHGLDYSTRPEDWRPIPHPWFHGEYYANPDLSGEPAARRTERPICFGCNPSRSPVPLPLDVPASGISVRWNGTLQTTLAGEYRFIVRVRGGARFMIDGETVIDSWTPAPSHGGPRANEATDGRKRAPSHGGLRASEATDGRKRAPSHGGPRANEATDGRKRAPSHGGPRASEATDGRKRAPGQEGADREVTAARRLPENASIPIRLEYAQGEGPMKIGLGWKTPAVDAQEEEALAAAKDADVVIYAGGISAQLEGEEMEVDYDGCSGGDRLRIELPELQQRFLERLRAVGKPIVFVNLSGSAVAMPWAGEHLNAVIQIWYPGQAGGTAVAEALMGDYNPAGRLPVTFYRATGDLPDFKDYGMAGRSYRYFRGNPLYPFGHGLSYTKFTYGGLRVASNADRSLTVSLDITNAGERDGDEVVQLYALPPVSSRPREIHALCGFHRVRLAKGETKEVAISVPAAALRRWSGEEGRYVIHSGEWIIQAAASSTDIRQTMTVRIP